MFQIINSGARFIPLADETVQCVVTSPPYWGLRDYGLPPSVWGGDEHEHEWGEIGPQHHPGQVKQTLTGAGPSHEGQTAGSGQFCPCGAWLGVLGLEPTPELYIEHMVEIFREVRRVLRKDGTVWMNLGDSYSSERWGNGPAPPPTNTGNKHAISKSRGGAGLKPKDLCGIPWRVALALQQDGWYLRSDIIWSKPNPMPESCTDRPTRSHEYLFLLTHSPKYFYDADAVREEAITVGDKRFERTDNTQTFGRNGTDSRKRTGNPTAGRNLRSVWHIATQPFPEAHFATFPQALVEPCIKAGTSEKGCCAECGSPWERVVEKASIVPKDYEGKWAQADPQSSGRRMLANVRARRESGEDHDNPFPAAKTLGWQSTCSCACGAVLDPIPCLVLDPFAGSGTVGVVCLKLGRSFVGIELKPDYCEMANKRVFNSRSLLQSA